MVVLGTAHVSSKSAQDALRVIQAVKPQNVVVELCRCASKIKRRTYVACLARGAQEI